MLLAFFVLSVAHFRELLDELELELLDELELELLDELELELLDEFMLELLDEFELELPADAVVAAPPAATSPTAVTVVQRFICVPRLRDVCMLPTFRSLDEANDSASTA